MRRRSDRIKVSIENGIEAFKTSYNSLSLSFRFSSHEAVASPNQNAGKENEVETVEEGMDRVRKSESLQRN